MLDRFLMGREKGKQLTTTKPASSSTNEQTAKELQELKVKLTKVIIMIIIFINMYVIYKL